MILFTGHRHIPWNNGDNIPADASTNAVYNKYYYTRNNYPNTLTISPLTVSAPGGNGAVVNDGYITLSDAVAYTISSEDVIDTGTIDWSYSWFTYSYR